MNEPTRGSVLDLADYRIKVAEIYGRWRMEGDGETAWGNWRRRRDNLLGSHPQSVMAATPDFRSLPFFEYDPSWRLAASWHEVEGEAWGDFRWVGLLRFERAGVEMELRAYWLDAYGGGLFVPFGDETNGETTYGGGRYLIDSAKGAYLGSIGDRVLLDFNGAFHPSCAHDPSWQCPLSPIENLLPVAVEAGERQ